jgi:hypothetical protein
VPSDAAGEYTVEVTMDTGPLAGKLTGHCSMAVAGQ